jgi:Fe2+ or Zn2+ uptake regulation protein
MAEYRFEEILRRLKLKVTPRRLAVLEAMARETSFLSAEQVWSKVSPARKMGLPTVYRILDELALSGIVTQVIRDDRQLYYFLCLNEKHHHHFVCTSCKKVEDIDLCLADELRAEVAQRLKGTLVSHIIQLQGLCSHCAPQEQQK